MPDVWATVTELDPATQQRLAGVLEMRGADPQQQALRRSFLADIEFPPRCDVLEIGCGTGVLTRTLARWPNVGTVIGVDPAPLLLEKARELAKDVPNVSFREADGRLLPFAPASFDVVIFDSVLSHIPGPDQALAEAFRVLRPSGWLAAFDGDYATTTVALGDQDPLQTCADAMMANSVHDQWVMRRVSAIARSCGFVVTHFRSHGFAETSGGAYMLSIIDRGADILLASGRAGSELAAGLKAEARRRVASGSFFGHIAYASLIARKTLS